MQYQGVGWPTAATQGADQGQAHLKSAGLDLRGCLSGLERNPVPGSKAVASGRRL